MLAFIQKEKCAKILSKICFFSFLLYIFETLSSFAEWIPGSTKYFVYSSTSGLILRMIVSFILVGTSLLVFISNKVKKNFNYIFAVFLMIIFEFLALAYTPFSYSVFFKTGQVYPFMAYRFISVSFKEAIVFSLSQSVDLIFGLLFLLVLPQVITKKRLFITLNIIILVVFYSSAYSFLKDRIYFINFFKGNWKYQNYSIGSIFGNKQQWGIFLISAFCASAFCIYLVSKSKLNKKIKFLLYCFYILTILCDVICGTVAFCKTAIISYLIFIIAFFIYLIIKLFVQKKTRIFAILIGIIVILAVSSVFVIYKVEKLHQSGLGKVIFNIFKTLENTSEGSISIRFTLVFAFLKKFPAANLMFGFPKGFVDPYVRVVVPEAIVGLHTGIATYFGKTGIFGLVIFTLILVKLFKIYFECGKNDKNLLFLYLTFFAISIVMNLSESEMLIFSSSMNGLILNLLLVTAPISQFEVFENEKTLFIINC